MMNNILNKRRASLLFLTLLLTLCCILSFSISYAADNETVDRIYDYADSLSDSEEDDLEALAETYYQKTGYNYLVVTTKTRSEYEFTKSSSLERDCELYSEAFYDDFVSTYGEDYEDCTILTIDLSDNRYADLFSQNDLRTKLDNERRTSVLKKITSALSDGDYHAAYEKYMKTVNRYQQIKPGVNPDNIFLKIWFQLLLALIIGGVIIVIMIFNTGGKMTATGSTYLDSKRSRTVNMHDHYTHTHTSRTKRESNDNSSSGGGSSSDSGHSGTHF